MVGGLLPHLKHPLQGRATAVGGTPASLPFSGVHPLIVGRPFPPHPGATRPPSGPSSPRPGHAPPPKGPAVRWRGRQLAKRTHTRSRDDRCAGAGAAPTPQPAHPPSDGAPAAKAGHPHCVVARTRPCFSARRSGRVSEPARRRGARYLLPPPSLPCLVEMPSPTRRPPRRRVHGRGRRRPCRPADDASLAGGRARQDSSAAAAVGYERGLTR